MYLSKNIHDIGCFSTFRCFSKSVSSLQCCSPNGDIVLSSFIGCNAGDKKVMAAQHFERLDLDYIKDLSQ